MVYGWRQLQNFMPFSTSLLQFWVYVIHVWIWLAAGTRLIAGGDNRNKPCIQLHFPGAHGLLFTLTARYCWLLDLQVRVWCWRIPLRFLNGLWKHNAGKGMGDCHDRMMCILCCFFRKLFLPFGLAVILFRT